MIRYEVRHYRKDNQGVCLFRYGNFSNFQQLVTCLQAFYDILLRHTATEK